MISTWITILVFSIVVCAIFHGYGHWKKAQELADCYIGYTSGQYYRDVLAMGIVEFIACTVLTFMVISTVFLAFTDSPVVTLWPI
jgi:hypothetical protein